MWRTDRLKLLLFFVLAAGCSEPEPSAPARIGHYLAPEVAGLPAKALPGGMTTHVPLMPGTRRTAEAFSQPSATLNAGDRGVFSVGNTFFSNAWVLPGASVQKRSGLGPLFNAASCQDCHRRDGRGHPPAGPDDTLRAALVRIGGTDGLALPYYGGQLQSRAAPGLRPEAHVQVSWTDSAVDLPDGHVVRLREPQLSFAHWADDPPQTAVRASLRIGPPLIGMGLLESIAEADILEQAARSDGRPNRVAGPNGTPRLGRFGWKAAQPDVAAQTFVAFSEDLGITSAALPQPSCTPSQIACRSAVGPAAPELDPDIGAAVVFYTAHLAPPARRDHDRPEVQAGERLFGQIGCADCHRPTWTTAADGPWPSLAGQTIFPYTDLLLHDMGDELADGLREGEAGGREWRTPPLWGLGLTHTVSGAQAGYLHDGRARTLSEAILWHGGNAKAARDRRAALPATQRRLVLRFLASL